VSKCQFLSVFRGMGERETRQIVEIMELSWRISSLVMWPEKIGLEKSQIKPEITQRYEPRTKKVHQ